MSSIEASDLAAKTLKKVATKGAGDAKAEETARAVAAYEKAGDVAGAIKEMGFSPEDFNTTKTPKDAATFGKMWAHGYFNL